jgi:hypothetical protein
MPAWMQNIDSPSIHFAVGMVCGGAIWLLVLLVRPRWWLYMPLAMMVGGLWAEGPDLPGIFKEFPSLAVADWIHGRQWREAMHAGWPNVFFFHGLIDKTGTGGGTYGFAIAATLYTAWIIILVAYIRRLRRAGRPEQPER